MAYFERIEKIKNITIFEKNHGLTPLKKNTNFATFSNRRSYCLESQFIYVERDQTRLFGTFSLKKKMRKIKIFEKYHGLFLLKKM